MDSPAKLCFLLPDIVVLFYLLFSQSGLILRPHRAKMNDTLLETLVILKRNSD